MTSIHGHPSLVLQLVERVIDSPEKLAITMFLHGAVFGSRSTATNAGEVSLSLPRTRELLVALLESGIVRTIDPYGSGWCFNRNSQWAPSVEALRSMYGQSRSEVLELIVSRTLATRGA